MILRLFLLAAVLLTSAVPAGAGDPPIARNLELEALQEAVRWPNAPPAAILAVSAQFLASRRDRDAYAYFQERAKAQPGQPLFLSLEGFFQARLAPEVPLEQRVAWVTEVIGKLDTAVGRAPGLTRFFRGRVFAQLPPDLGKAQAAVEDFEWIIQNRQRFPRGVVRNAHRGLAQALTTLGRTAEATAALARSGSTSLDPDEPQFTTDSAITAKDGVRQAPPELLQVAPKVYVARGYDFADLVFVETADGVVAIDAGSSETRVRTALAAFRKVSSRPITHVLLTHAHWDHIGGLGALKGPRTQVIAPARFPEELRTVNETSVQFRSFTTSLFGPEGPRRLHVVPNRLVAKREKLTIGRTEFVVYPVRSGETEDALVIHLPASGGVFVGDAFMPWLGAPFVAEGSPEGFFETIELVRSLKPKLLIHGHAALTQNFTMAALEGLDAGLREVYERTRRAIGEGKTLAEILDENVLPRVLQAHPAAVVAFVVARENFIKRTYHQRTGYWKPDGDGMETIPPKAWAAALDLLGGGQEAAFVRSVRTLVERGDHALAHRLVDLALMTYPESQPLLALRRQAVNGLRERYQALNPFKFYVYTDLIDAELPFGE
jgi:glyoxylase-like metal-dependent hydrolase (beta-lactamase superfamily II)